METELPNRKPTRLQNFDYNSVGAYFITICTQDKQKILSHIVGTVGDAGPYGIVRTVGDAGNRTVGDAGPYGAKLDRVAICIDIQALLQQRMWRKYLAISL